MNLRMLCYIRCMGVYDVQWHIHTHHLFLGYLNSLSPIYHMYEWIEGAGLAYVEEGLPRGPFMSQQLHVAQEQLSSEVEALDTGDAIACTPQPGQCGVGPGREGSEQ